MYKRQETYRSKEIVKDADFSLRKGAHSASTSIYYLLTPDTFSELHRLNSDEVFHFYLGDPVEQLMLYPDGTGETVILGPDIFSGQKVQHVVPQGVWQGAKLKAGGQFALLGCTVAPSFEFSDYSSGICSKLQSLYPKFKDHIKLLTQN